jgi:predicted metalloprotease
VEWKGRRQSTNIEDRRGMRIPGGVGGMGAGVVLLAIGLAYCSGVDPSQLLSQIEAGGGEIVSGAETRPISPEEEAQAEFIRVVLADTEDVWNQLFAQQGSSYVEPTLVLFGGAVQSACGTASSAVGPFYCPGDSKVYIDLAFFDELDRALGAPGDFAQAYVLAHEVGHHVQNLLGISEQVHSAQRRAGESEANQLSVRMELQADFLAGVWAHHAERMKQMLEPGDIDEALNAASRIGDDVLQRRAGGHVMPDSFTHGTAEQRARWFKKGLESGRIEDGDTFNARDP